tara:strand:+ start:57 stop:662 length:606 start_codon:yes stop_codon:yes gene_type:complete
MEPQVTISQYSARDMRHILSLAKSTIPDMKISRITDHEKAAIMKTFLIRGKYSIFKQSFITCQIVCSRFVMQELLLRDFHVSRVKEASNGEVLKFVLPAAVTNDAVVKANFAKVCKNVKTLYESLHGKVMDAELGYFLPACVQTHTSVTGNYFDWLRFCKLQYYNNVSDELKIISSTTFDELNRTCAPVFNKTNIRLKFQL